MLQFVQRLAIADHEARKTMLAELLHEIGADYEIQRSTIEGVLVENFIVKYGSAQKRIVVGAHYDSVPGSTGANDNASGVSILLELIRQFNNHPPQVSLDVVFFDYEEKHALGSRLYCEAYAENTLAMINADICGVGDSVLIGPRKNLQNGVLAAALEKLDPQALGFGIVDMLPSGDDRIFEGYGVPNISVCIVEARDVEPMAALFSDQQDVPKESYPSIIETMHNGSRDTVEVVEQEALERVTRFIHGLIVNIQ